MFKKMSPPEAGKFVKPIGAFVLGIVFTVTVAPAFTAVGEFFFGFEIQSAASFPAYHRARLYSRPGLGDQTLTLEVDGSTVWIANDAAGGDLDEKLSWDETGHVLTLEIKGANAVIYDARNQKIRYRSY
jgi:hypothetical protein